MQKDTVDKSRDTNLPVKAFTNVEAQDFSEHIVIPHGYTKIDRETFWNRSDVKSIVIPDNVKSIGKDAFEECNNLTNNNPR
jgi:5-methylthioribose kinase